MLSDLRHWPLGIEESQEKLAMKTQPIKDATNCPNAHQTDRRVRVHYNQKLWVYFLIECRDHRHTWCDCGICSKYRAPLNPWIMHRLTRISLKYHLPSTGKLWTSISNMIRTILPCKYRRAHLPPTPKPMHAMRQENATKFGAPPAANPKRPAMNNVIFHSHIKELSQRTFQCTTYIER